MQYVFLIRSRAGNTSLGSASWRISYRRRSSVSKTRIAWARDRFYIYLVPNPGNSYPVSTAIVQKYHQLRPVFASIHDVKQCCSSNVLSTSHSQTLSFDYSYSLSQWNHHYHKLWCSDSQVVVLITCFHNLLRWNLKLGPGIWFLNRVMLQITSWCYKGEQRQINLCGHVCVSSDLLLISYSGQQSNVKCIQVLIILLSWY